MDFLESWNIWLSLTDEQKQQVILASRSAEAKPSQTPEGLFLVPPDEIETAE